MVQPDWFGERHPVDLRTAESVTEFGKPRDHSGGEDTLLIAAPRLDKFTAGERNQTSARNRVPYIFRRQTTPTSSQYQSQPSQIVMPCGSGSESVSWIFSRTFPVFVSCLKKAFRFESVHHRNCPSHPRPCGRLPK